MATFLEDVFVGYVTNKHGWAVGEQAAHLFEGVPVDDENMFSDAGLRLIGQELNTFSAITDLDRREFLMTVVDNWTNIQVHFEAEG